MVVAGVEKWRQLPGGDLLAGTQAAVLGHQGGGEGGGGGGSCRQDDGAGTGLDGAVVPPLLLEGEALPALSPLPEEQLSGLGGRVSTHQEDTLAGDCRGVATPVVQGVPPVLPARGGQLVTAVIIAGDEGVLPAVEGGVTHPPGEGGQGAVHLPGGRGPELGRGGGKLASDYSKP